jgi:hypothetical protein
MAGKGLAALNDTYVIQQLCWMKKQNGSRSTVMNTMSPNKMKANE